MAESDTHNSHSPKGSPAPSDSSDVASQEHHGFLGPQSPDDIELDSIDACSHRSSSSRTSSEAPREHHSSLSYAPLEQSAPVSPKVAAQADALVDKAIDDEESGFPPSTRLKRSIYTILIALVYTGLALFAWILLCIQSFRPITTKSYSLNAVEEELDYANSDYDFTSKGGVHPQTSPYVRNEEYFRHARVVQALTSVLTIPLTSALYSKAAVAFFQRRASMGLSMRKLTTMADRGWADPETISKVLLGGWQKYASSFLVFAILLNVLGVVRQFILRFNVSISRENITGQGMPKECNEDQPGVFYVKYASEAKDDEKRIVGDWALEACMPANQERSPWRATRSRQDFTETLYLNLRSDSPYIADSGVPAKIAGYHVFKITLNTTARYFEFAIQIVPNSTVELGNDVNKDQAPMIGLLRGTRGEDIAGANEPIGVCITEELISCLPVGYQISAYVRAFIYNHASSVALDGDGRISNAFLSAAYLALQAWMDNPNPWTSYASIMFDLGADTDIPVISRTGMVLISILLGLDLTCLLGLAIYSSLTPTWTHQFDAFAMMRLGAAMHEDVPLHVSHSHSQVKVLDTMSGFVGDGPEETSNGSIRQLTLGANAPVQRQRKYRSYK
ncbi:hypothetical protein D0866_00593 [Hortaea werneckii]|uniref:Uncharacterized protein n=1 Tax=Hortaea werneckii TaxID=91943 RepID=A0A3M7BNM7_HORWE|nr:hypothetical protein D0866_00593 [Hortaea werneckii]